MNNQQAILFGSFSNKVAKYFSRLSKMDHARNYTDIEKMTLGNFNPFLVFLRSRFFHQRHLLSIYIFNVREFALLM